MSLWQTLEEPWRIALEEAWTAYRAGSLPIGAVVVDRDNQVVGSGRNRIFEQASVGSTALCGHHLAHAEMNALLDVDHSAVHASECVLFTTLEPCVLCVGAIRMLRVGEVRYAAADPAAGSLALFDASDFMRRCDVRIQYLHNHALEAVLVALHVEALLRLTGHPLPDSWRAAASPGVDFGQELFASGDLRRLAEAHASIAPVLEDLLARYPDHAQVLPRSAPLHEPVGDRPLVLIVTGAPASGKSTLGKQLAQTLGLPFLSKDLFKETLFDELGWSDRAWSRRLGGACMRLLFRSAAALLAAGQSVALESNFYSPMSTPEFHHLAERFDCQFAQLVCTASKPTLVERYKRRIETGERHPGHTESEDVEDILNRLRTEQWDALELAGPIYRLDTERADVADQLASIARVLQRTRSLPRSSLAAG